MSDDQPQAQPITVTVDARGLACPLPVLRLRKTLTAQPAGAVVELLATDRAAARDVPAFCQSAGHAVLRADQDKDGLRFVIRRG